MLAEGTLAGKTALVTGGGTGIGLAIAKEYARLGANVAIASRKPEVLEAAAKEIEAVGGSGKVAWFAMDVRQPDAIDRTAVEIAARLGPVDVLVNNAAGNFVVPAAELSPRGWQAVIDIVLNGTWFCTHAFGKRMIERGTGGSILNVVATYAWTGGPGTIHSASAKAGVLAMTETLAVEWAMHGIRVNAIAPGPVENTGGAAKLWAAPEIGEAVRRTVPVGRFGKPEEVAWLAGYLASEYAAFVNGACLVIDGGAWLNKGAFALLPT
jgi:NAD(P)-dependent dehydrogenase (short-subunit alcohol dehydrogenase family)